MDRQKRNILIMSAIVSSISSQVAASNNVNTPYVDIKDYDKNKHPKKQYSLRSVSKRR